MITPTYTLPCLQNTQIAADIFELRFSKPPELEYSAGQFMMWSVPALDDPMTTEPRAYSIASAPTESELLFIIKYLSGGRCSEWIKQVLKVGDKVIMQGPMGRFHVDTDSQKNQLFVCTSTGNAPFRSMIKHALETGDQRRIDLIFGVHTEDGLYWLDEFEALTQQYPNFYFHPTISNPSANWKGHVGWVQTLFDKVVRDIAERQVYVCGHPDMCNEVKTHCLEDLGLERCDVHVEGYI